MKCLCEIKMLIPMKKTYIRISPDILQKQQLSLPLTGFHGITRDYVSLKQFGNKCQGVTRSIMNHHSKIIVAP